MIRSRLQRRVLRSFQAAALAITAMMLLWAFQPVAIVEADAVAQRGTQLRRTPTVRVVESAGPSVVNITTERIVAQSPFRSPFQNDPRLNRYFRDFVEPRRKQTVRSLGSGVLIDAAHHVLTNEHVIRHASAIYVTLADGREFEATLVGADPSNDMAVLRVETDEPLPWIPLGRTDDLLVGEPVIAIGNPHGFSNTVTTGVISALERSLNTQNSATDESTTLHGLIQTDASINPGNSGGPLLNAEGTLIGINTAVYWRPDQPTNAIGFAIPISVAGRVINELIEYGEVVPSWLGIQFQNLDPSLHDVLRLPDSVSGIIVNGVSEGSPGEASGLERGDIVMQMDQRTLRHATDFYDSLRSVRTDQTVVLGVWRDSKLQSIDVIARELPLEQALGLTEAVLAMRLDATDGAGFTINTVKRGSAAAKIGFHRGDILLGIGGRPLKDMEALRNAVAPLRWLSRAQIVVMRGQNQYQVVLPLR